MEAVFAEVQPLVQGVAAGGAACVIAHGQANATEALLTSGSAQSPSLGMRAITALLKCVTPMRFLLPMLSILILIKHLHPGCMESSPFLISFQAPLGLCNCRAGMALAGRRMNDPSCAQLCLRSIMKQCATCWVTILPADWTFVRLTARSQLQWHI